MATLLPEHVDGMRLRSRRPDEVGGEWDAVRGWPARVQRRLRGAGYLGCPDGYAPDQLAHDLADVTGDIPICDVMQQWCRAVLKLLMERRRERARQREARLARQHGHPTWNAYRAALYRGRRPEAHSIHRYAQLVGWRPTATTKETPLCPPFRLTLTVSAAEPPAA